jgi:Putative transposase.
MEIITWNISIKFILECKRKCFLQWHKNLIRASVLENVQKVLDCWSHLWASFYRCDSCWETKHVFFTCKSRFCNSCSQPQSDIWIDKLFSRLPRGISYHHIVLTIPEELRIFFKKHRGTLSLLPKTASDSVCYFLQEKLHGIPWIIAIIHTFWAKLNWNPHVHLLITHGVFSLKKNTFIKEGFFLPYVAIRQSWTKRLLKHLKDWVYSNLSGDYMKQEIRFLNTFYDYKNKEGENSCRYGFFSKQCFGFEKIVGYIGRYVKRPPIAQSRIIHYDWDIITFEYEDKLEKIKHQKIKKISCSDIEFLELLVQHIPNKYFHMVYYYGIFANRVKGRFINIINSLFRSPRIYPKPHISFRGRYFLWTWSDPLTCTCGWLFHKYMVSIPWYPPFFFDSS